MLTSGSVFRHPLRPTTQKWCRIMHEKDSNRDFAGPGGWLCKQRRLAIWRVAGRFPVGRRTGLVGGVREAAHPRFLSHFEVKKPLLVRRGLPPRKRAPPASVLQLLGYAGCSSKWWVNVVLLPPGASGASVPAVPRPPTSFRRSCRRRCCAQDGGSVEVAACFPLPF